jgi:hypothetical protein
VRSDLMWRKRAMEIINFDLISDNKSSVYEVNTLDWRSTYDFLVKLYKSDNNKYRFNVLLAPLGSKMQSVGAWAFAERFKMVKVVTSTPKELFPDKYSRGWKDTFLIDDLFAEFNERAV